MYLSPISVIAYSLEFSLSLMEMNSNKKILKLNDIPITATANFINQHGSFCTRCMGDTFFNHIAENRSIGSNTNFSKSTEHSH